MKEDLQEEHEDVKQKVKLARKKEIYDKAAKRVEEKRVQQFLLEKSEITHQQKRDQR